MALSRRRSSPRPGGFTWDAGISRYRGENGRIVSPVAVREALDEAIRASETRARSLGESLINGDISATAFYREMRSIVKSVHLYSAASAKGGWAQMTPSDYGRVGQIVRGEYQYLNNFAAEIASGLPLGGIPQRAGLYAQAGRLTYDQTQTADMGRIGKTEEKNILHPAEHCDGFNSCVEQTARGWVPIGSLIPIGNRKCGRRCKCTKAFR